MIFLYNTDTYKDINDILGLNVRLDLKMVEIVFSTSVTLTEYGILRLRYNFFR